VIRTLRPESPALFLSLKSVRQLNRQSKKREKKAQVQEVKKTITKLWRVSGQVPAKAKRLKLNGL
jgi:hypothetical protein